MISNLEVQELDQVLAAQDGLGDRSAQLATLSRSDVLDLGYYELTEIGLNDADQAVTDVTAKKSDSFGMAVVRPARGRSKALGLQTRWHLACSSTREVP